MSIPSKKLLIILYIFIYPKEVTFVKILLVLIIYCNTHKNKYITIRIPANVSPQIILWSTYGSMSTL